MILATLEDTAKALNNRVLPDDPRLSDAREPLPHMHGDISGHAKLRSGVAVIGDSITYYNVDGDHVWHKYGAMRSGQYLRWLAQFSTPGHTLAQIEANHLPSVLAMSPLPGACIVAGGTNDVGQGAGWSILASIATHQRICGALVKVGILPILWAIPPRGDNVTANANASRWNVYIRSYAQRMGYAVVDAHGALVDKTTGGFAAALNLGDGIHPNPAGHAAIGESIAANALLMDAVADGAPHLADSAADPANLASGMSMSWSWNNGYSNTTVNDLASPLPWTRLSVPSGNAGGSGGMQAVIGGITGGHVYALAARIRSDHGGTSQVRFTIPVDFKDGSGANVLSTTIGGTEYTPQQATGAIAATLTAPANATQLQITWQLVTKATTTKAQTFDVSQFTIYDLTAAGVA